MGFGAPQQPQVPPCYREFAPLKAETEKRGLAVKAATTGDPVLARKALLAHPLVGQTAKVDDLLEDLLAVAAP